MSQFSSASESSIGKIVDRLELPSTTRSTTSASDWNSHDTKKSLLQKFVGIFCPPKRVDKREKWETPWETNPWYFRLVATGSCIGMGNVWRFPYLVARYGGGAFLFAYVFVFVFVAYPILFLELYLGQFSGRKPIDFFSDICPALGGVSWAALGATMIFQCYYNAIFSWAIFYTLSFNTPWTRCDQPWNSKDGPIVEAVESSSSREFFTFVLNDPKRIIHKLYQPL